MTHTTYAPMKNTADNPRKLDHSLLWDKIDSLAIGPPDASLSFARRLARENAWSRSYAQEVVAEYKRFLYLAAISKHELTPSDQVDQAWHLHLSYTKSYWKDLCEGVLGFALHHNPTAGGDTEQHRFRQQYLTTLDFYAEVFGERAPRKIWPAPDQRFEAVEDFVRVNRSTAWVVTKPTPPFARLSVSVTLPLLLVACTDVAGDQNSWFWLKVAFGIFIVYKIFSWLDTGRGGGGSSGGGSGCGGCGGCGD